MHGIHGRVRHFARSAVQVRPRHQSQDREGARSRTFAVAPRARRRSDRAAVRCMSGWDETEKNSLRAYDFHSSPSQQRTKGAAFAAPFALLDAWLFVRTDQKSIPPIEVGLARLRSLQKVGGWIRNPSRPCHHRPAWPAAGTTSSALRRPWLPWSPRGPRPRPRPAGPHGQPWRGR
jgi:hypothetical protein